MLLTYLIYKLGIKNVEITEAEFLRLKSNKGIKNPLAGKLVLTSPFGWRIQPKTGKQEFHNGVDLVFPYPTQTSGQPIYAPLSGKISANYSNALGGNQLILDSGFAKFGFAHLLQPSPLPVGTIVKKGQEIGKVGNTGLSTGAHLHFTLRLNGAVVDPLKNLPDLFAATKI